MFNKQKEGFEIKEAETIIGPSVRVRGDFHGQGNLIVEGVVEGSLKTDNNLYVGDKAKIIADIEAREARIGGEIKGNIKVKGYLEIAASAKIFGDIVAGGLLVERGAILNGKISMSPENMEKGGKKE